MNKTTALLLIITFAALGLVLPATEGAAGEAKAKLERALIGQWKVPKNRYKETITFDFTTARKFECVHTVPKQEPVTWSGDWKVRTTHDGKVKAYLRARNQAGPEKYMKAIVTSDSALDKFFVRITFNFNSDDSSNWSSPLKLATAGDDEEDEDLGDEEDFEDEDFEEEDFEEEDFEEEEDLEDDTE